MLAVANIRGVTNYLVKPRI